MPEGLGLGAVANGPEHSREEALVGIVYLSEW